MRLTVFIIALVAAFASPLAGQLRWEKTYGPQNSDVCQVVATPDGGFAMLAYFGVDASLVRTDSAGDTLWTRLLPPQDYCTILVTQDGGFLSTGASRASNRDFVALRMDSQGDTLWSRIYPDSMDQGHYTVLGLSDGGFLLTGYTRSQSGSYDMFVVRTDSLGNQQWKRSYGTTAQDLGAMPAINRSGGFAFSTTTSSTGPSDILVVTTDSAGVQIWSQTYSAPQALGGAVTTALSDGGYLIMGWVATLGYNSYLMRLDSAGTVLWSNNYGGIGFESRTARGAIEDSRGGYTFVTSTDLTFAPGTDRDIALVRVDTNGTLVEMMRIGGSKEDMPRYYQQLADGGFIVAGYSASIQPGIQQAYLARIDSAGCGERFFDLGYPQRDTLCPDDTLTLDAGPGYVSYTWSNGANSQRIEITAADTYWVAAMDSAGCLFYSTLLYIEAQPGPSFSYLDQGNLLVDFAASPASASNWSWDFGDGQGSTLQNPSHVYPGPGPWWVCLDADIPQCGRYAVCDSVVLTATSLAPAMDMENMSLGYDPAVDKLRIRSGTSAELEGLHLEIWSVSGQRVAHFKLPRDGESEMDASQLSQGLYAWRVRAGDRVVSWGKVVVSR